MSVELRKLFWANVLVTTSLAAKLLDRNARIRWAIARDQLSAAPVDPATAWSIRNLFRLPVAVGGDCDARP